MRIVTRPDFDGVVCAALLSEVETIDQAIKWVEPAEIQHSRAEIDAGDILANLPYDRRCSLWFDHHFTNRIDHRFNGDYKLAPSAARVVFDYYHDRFQRDFGELIDKADKIDTADFTRNEVLHPESEPYFLLSLTLSDLKFNQPDDDYLQRLVYLLRTTDIDGVIEDIEVKKQWRHTIEQNGTFRSALESYAVLLDQVSIVDLRQAYPVPAGNRFLIYTMFPESAANLEIGYIDDRKTNICINAGYNIFNRKCRVNIGMMLSRFGGGGHQAAGGCILQADEADRQIAEIIEILAANQPYMNN